MPEPVLVVPVDVEALVVNDAILRRDSFRWWQYNYLALKQYRSPEPEAGDRGVGGQPAGVYVSWTLPRALRHGTQDPKTGEISYPLVPNRWLVLRLSGGQPRHVTGWVVESDCPYTARAKTLTGVERTSMYLADAQTIRAWKGSTDAYRNGVTLDPNSTEPQVANLGVPFPLAQGWSERAAAPMFLTAVAPGNPTFGAYAPHNLGVFTFIDDLKDLPQQGPQPLSYLVAGWYSDPAGDVLASWQHDVPDVQHPDPYQALLDRLDWGIAGRPDGTRATRSLYKGSALTVEWDPMQPPAVDPLVKVRSSGQLQVSLGNTAEDAFLALVSQRLVAAGHPARTVAQLRAFLYGLLPLANQPDGDALVRRAIAAQWFGAHAGGQQWTVTSADTDSSPQQPSAPAFQPPAWLDRLNADQRRLDLAVTALRAGQWDLNAMWWKRGRYPYDSFPTPPPGVDSIDLLDAQLDPDRPGSLAARVVGLLQEVLSGTAAVPQPIEAGAATPQEALQKGITEWAGRQGLPPDQVLKALPAEPYWQAADPVVMVSGVEAPAEADADSSLAVRQLSTVVTALSVGGTPVGEAAARAVVPTLPALPGFSGPPEIAGPVVTEFLLTDPGCADALAAATGLSPQALNNALTAHNPAEYTGVLPAAGLQPWSQPWRPLFAEWQVRYIDVPQAPVAGAWRFDGTDYSCAQGSAAGESRTIGGICLLGPHAPQVFRARLAEFVQQYGSGDDLAQLDSWVEQLNGWRFLSQELTGFGKLLARHDQRGFRRPRSEDRIGTAHPYQLADILGYRGAATTPTSLADRYRGAVTSVPYLPAGSDVPFFGMRQGQIIFQELVLYDRFGRTLPVILPGAGSGLYDPENFPLIVDPALAPTATLDPRAAAPAQLPPRLLQPARLDFTPLDAVSGADSTLTAAADPIGGWILPNHLDRALLLYAPDGTALGEMRVVEGPAEARFGHWTPPPHSTVTSEADVARLAPMVGALIGSPILTSATGFGAFLESIDSTLWTTDPLGNRADQNLSVLIGRPLALVRARVRLELEGPPIADSGWSATLAPPAPGFPQQRFAVRLGDQATRDDGLIGYFAAGDLSVFNTVAVPATDPAGAAAAGLRAIGATLPDGTTNYLWRPCVHFEDPGAADRPDPADEIVMVLDPRGSVHATTGILPTRGLALRPDQVGAALARLEVSFLVGAALATIRPTETPAGQPPAFPESVAFPRPAEDQGTWSWWLPGSSPDAWTGYGAAAPGTDASLRPAANLLLDAVLQLVINQTTG
jgi:hypothetical protein